MFTSHKSLFSLAGAAVLILSAPIAQATVLSVPSTATPTIQSAINASAAGDVIIVAAGTYHESLDWENKDLTLQGAGAGVSILDPSVANGGPGGSCLFTTNLTPASLIEGFTFQNGHIADTGGGVNNLQSSPTITNCIFSDNSANFGGGMCNFHYCNPIVTNCIFSNNGAQLQGGGMYNYDNSSPEVTNCTFYYNSAQVVGGGMFCDYFSSPVVTDCTFYSNSASDGGGMFNNNNIPSVTNCTFTQNKASDQGGGMYNFGSNPPVTNCILWGNSAAAGGPEYAGFGIFTHSDIQGLSNTKPDASGNFGADPHFVDALNGNLRLTSSSPCRAHGNLAVILSPPFLTVGGIIVDLDGNPRIAAGAVDLGAYEYHKSPPVLSVPTSVSGIVGKAVTFTATAVDPNMSVLTFSLVHPPAGAGINSATGQVSFITSVAKTYNLQVKVTNAAGLSASKTVQAVIASDPSGSVDVQVAAPSAKRVNATTIKITFNLINSGAGTAQNVRVASASLNGVAASALAGPFTLPAGNSRTVTLTFVSATLTPGAAVFTVSGADTSGGFSSSVNLVLP